MRKLLAAMLAVFVLSYGNVSHAQLNSEFCFVEFKLISFPDWAWPDMCELYPHHVLGNTNVLVNKDKGEIYYLYGTGNWAIASGQTLYKKKTTPNSLGDNSKFGVLTEGWQYSGDVYVRYAIPIGYLVWAGNGKNDAAWSIWAQYTNIEWALNGVDMSPLGPYYVDPPRRDWYDWGPDINW